jgi:hypothetical protein
MKNVATFHIPSWYPLHNACDNTHITRNSKVWREEEGKRKRKGLLGTKRFSCM